MSAARVDELVRELGLAPHPEGGWYREVFRSDLRVGCDLPVPARSASTAIYFLLAAGGHSRWHRVSPDEVWHHYEGGPLELLWFYPGGPMHREILAPVGAGRPVVVIPAGAWQSARPLAEHTLAGCTVAPGFEFADFQMMSDYPEAVAELGRISPEHLNLV